MALKPFFEQKPKKPVAYVRQQLGGVCMAQPRNPRAATLPVLRQAIVRFDLAHSREMTVKRLTYAEQLRQVGYKGQLRELSSLALSRNKAVSTFKVKK